MNDIAELQPHPASQLWPMLKEPDLQELADDIAERGQLVPIVLCEGMILDGRNRYKACGIAGVEPEYIQFTGGDPYLHVYSLNGKRRNDVDAIAKALIFDKTLERSEAWIKQHAKIKRDADKKRSDAAKTQHKISKPYAGEKSRDGDCSKGTTTIKRPEAERAPTRAAKSEGSGLSQATHAKADSIKNFDADIAEKVISGEMTGGQALKAVKQEKLAQKKIENAEQSAKSVTDNKPTANNSDALDWLAAIEPFSVDLLITDPPYSTDVDDIEKFASDWLAQAIPTLKQTGRAYICIGAYPNELLAYIKQLNEKLFDGWVIDNPLIWTYRNALGVTPKMKYNLNYQVILHCYNEEHSRELDTSITNEMFSVQDINAPDGRQGDRFHTWQKPDELADRLIRHSSVAGDVVIDPFCCTGTFLLAAARQGCLAAGCDISGENLEIAAQRGCNVA